MHTKLRDHLKEQSKPVEGGEVAIQLPIEASDLVTLDNVLDPIGAPTSPADLIHEQAETSPASTDLDNMQAQQTSPTEDGQPENENII